ESVAVADLFDLEADEPCARLGIPAVIAPTRGAPGADADAPHGLECAAGVGLGTPPARPVVNELLGRLVEVTREADVVRPGLPGVRLGDVADLAHEFVGQLEMVLDQ